MSRNQNTPNTPHTPEPSLKKRVRKTTTTSRKEAIEITGLFNLEFPKGKQTAEEMQAVYSATRTPMTAAGYRYHAREAHLTLNPQLSKPFRRTHGGNTDFTSNRYARRKGSSATNPKKLSENGSIATLSEKARLRNAARSLKQFKF